MPHGGQLGGVTKVCPDGGVNFVPICGETSIAIYGCHDLIRKMVRTLVPSECQQKFVAAFFDWMLLAE